MKRLGLLLVLTLVLAFSVLADGDTPTGGKTSCGGENQPPCFSSQTQTDSRTKIQLFTVVIVNTIRQLRIL